MPSGSREMVQTEPELKAVSCSALSAVSWWEQPSAGRLRQKAFGLGCLFLREPHLDRNSTRLSFCEVDFPLSPRCRTDPTGVAGLWLLLSVNAVDICIGLLPDPLSLLVTVCSPNPARFHSTRHCLQMEMQALVVSTAWGSRATASRPKQVAVWSIGGGEEKWLSACRCPGCAKGCMPHFQSCTVLLPGEAAVTVTTSSSLPCARQE